MADTDIPAGYFANVAKNINAHAQVVECTEYTKAIPTIVFQAGNKLKNAVVNADKGKKKPHRRFGVIATLYCYHVNSITHNIPKSVVSTSAGSLCHVKVYVTQFW